MMKRLECAYPQSSGRHGETPINQHLGAMKWSFLIAMMPAALRAGEEKCRLEYK